jgi:hypothetical protein
MFLFWREKKNCRDKILEKMLKRMPRSTLASFTGLTGPPVSNQRISWNDAWLQGDQIWRFFSFWAIFFLFGRLLSSGSYLKTIETDQNFIGT